MFYFVNSRPDFYYLDLCLQCVRNSVSTPYDDHKYPASASFEISAAFCSFVLYRHHSRHVSGHATCSCMAGLDRQSLRWPRSYDRPLAHAHMNLVGGVVLLAMCVTFYLLPDFYRKKDLFHKVGPTYFLVGQHRRLQLLYHSNGFWHLGRIAIKLQPAGCFLCASVLWPDYGNFRHHYGNWILYLFGKRHFDSGFFIQR